MDLDKSNLNPIKKNHKHSHNHIKEKHSNATGKSHSEINVLYKFSCLKIDELSSIEVQLFKRFSGIKKINAQWVNPNGQGQVLLDKNRKSINFN